MRNVCLMPKVAMIVQDEAKPTVAGDVCPTVPGLHVYSKLRIQEIVLSAECVECRVCIHLGPKVAMMNQKMCPFTHSCELTNLAMCGFSML